MSKKGQIALWVILALALVAVIALFFVIQRMPTTTTKEAFNPEQYIRQCTKDSVNEATNIMLLQGGFLEPKNYKVYNRTKIEYICLFEGYSNNCINIHPLFMKELADEIKTYIQPEIESCFETMVEAARSSNQEIEIGPEMDINVSLTLNKVVINIMKKVTVKQGEETRTFEKFDAEITSPIYDLASTAIEIANSEARSCDFDRMNYMRENRNIDIGLFVTSDSSKIYSIKEKSWGDVLSIATRGCVSQPGGS